MRHVLLFATVLTVSACPDDGRPDDLAAIPAAGITGAPGEESSTGDPEGDEPRLDLGDAPPIPDLPAEGTSTGAVDDTSTGEPETSSSSSSSTGDLAGTSTGEAETGSTGEGSSSTGEPEPPAVCGDGTCHASERAPCWGWKQGGGWADGWCFEDCAKDPACESDCECSEGAATIKNFCYSDPPLKCSATEPGGFCDPNGGAFSDVVGHYAWAAKCG